MDAGQIAHLLLQAEGVVPTYHHLALRSALCRRASEYAHLATGRVPCCAGDDIDHSQCCVTTVEDRTRARDHFDAFHVIQRDSIPDGVRAEVVLI